LINKLFCEKNMPSGLVAQLVEQSPEKACVAGSIPAQTTIFNLQFYSHIDNQPIIEMLKRYTSTHRHHPHAERTLS
jgi:RNase adaptor protein for sRNA GlmZ degradation